MAFLQLWKRGRKKKQASRLNGERSIGGRTIPEDRSSRRFSHEWDSLGKSTRRTLIIASRMSVDFYFLCRESSSREIPSFLPLSFFLLWFMQTSGKFLNSFFSCNFCSQVNIELYITRMELWYGWIVFISRIKIEILDTVFFLLRKFVVALRVFIE